MVERRKEPDHGVRIEPPTNVLLRSEQSGGHVSVMENIVRAGSAGPPLHMHDFDEAFYMLEGEWSSRSTASGSPGAPGSRFAARNVTHALANHSEADARYLLVCTPAGLERHFARAAASFPGDRAAHGRSDQAQIIVVGPQIARDA